jgi:hypothetical protein
VGKHMESIALAALPRENGSDSESDSDIGSATTTSNVHPTLKEYPDSGHQGKYVGAETMDQQTLQLQEAVLGKEHPDTLASMSTLATSLRKQGKYAEAEAIDRILSFNRPRSS